MATGDVYQLKVSQTPYNAGDEALNVFFYQLLSGSDPLADFLDEWQTSVMVEMQQMQVVSLLYNYLEVTNLYDPVDFERLDFAVGSTHGAIDLVSSPPSTAINFTLQRSSRLVRNGSKRLAGLPNAAVATGQVTDATYITNLNAIADAFAADVTFGVGSSVMTPVIVGRVKTANPDYPEHSRYPFIYSLPDTDGETPTPHVRGVKFSTYASTQVSRKTNR